jgi:hypothetical protein
LAKWLLRKHLFEGSVFVRRQGFIAPTNMLAPDPNIRHSALARIRGKVSLQLPAIGYFVEFDDMGFYV